MAEQIREAIEKAAPSLHLVGQKVDIVNAILTVINPLCNEVARLEADEHSACQRSNRPAAQLHELTRLATAVVDAELAERRGGAPGTLQSTRNGLRAAVVHRMDQLSSFLAGNPVEDPLRKLANNIVAAMEELPITMQDLRITQRRLGVALDALAAHIRNGGTGS